MSGKQTLYALSKKEYNDYINNIFCRRRSAYELLNDSLKDKDPDNWVSFYAVLCEYISVLYRFEEALERAALIGDWNEEKQYWLLDQETAGFIAIFATSKLSCQYDLLGYNVSLSLH